MLWKFIDRPREDSLTAAVFSHLLHLPSEVFWSILRAACPSARLPDDPGEPLSVHPWPNWSAAGTTNECRVIPDLVIEFQAFDLIVEAKRRDHGMQDREQWEKELIAYANEYGSKKREVRMIALGGIHSDTDVLLIHEWSAPSTKGGLAGSDRHRFECPVHMCQWSSVLLECQRLKRKLKETSEPTSQTFAKIRILTDLIGFFVFHHFPPLRWFADFTFQPNLLYDSVYSDRQSFRKISLQYQQS